MTLMPFINCFSKTVAFSNSLTFLILLFFISHLSSGTNYYIDSVGGVDTNNGTTISTPWRNLSKINVVTLVAGDKVYLKCGSVWNGQQLKFGGSGTALSPIIVDQYGTGAKPILNGNGLTTANQGVVYLYNQDYIEINNLELTNYPILLLYANSTAYILNQIVYNGTKAYQVTGAGTTPASGGAPTHSSGAVGSGTVTFTFYCNLTNLPYPDNMFFTGITDGTLFNNPLGADRRGVMVAIKDKGVCNHVYLKNLNIHHIKGQLGNGQNAINGAVPKRTAGIYFAVLNEAPNSNSRFNDILIDGCAINYVENTGLAFDNEDDVYYPGGNELALWTARKFTNIKVSNNVIHHIGKNAMIIRCTDETGLIEYNTCYETAVGTTGNTMFSARAKGTVFQYNEGYFNRSTTQNVDPGGIDGSMYDPDYGSVGVIFQYSYSHDNSEGIYWGCNTRSLTTNNSGIPDPEDVGCTLRYCVSQNDMGSIVFFNYPSAGNEIYNNIFYIKSGLSPNIIHENSKQHTYNYYNNIIYNNSITAEYSFKATGQTRNILNNNFFGFHNNTADILLNEPADAFKTISDPLLVNPGTGSPGTGSLSINSLEGYKLRTGSPALTNGKVVTANGGKDYFGNAVSSSANPNRGVFEGSAIFPFFYSKNASNLSDITNWGLNAADGSGTPPQNFIENNQGFVVRDVSSTLNSNWTVSGTNSILKIGYDAIAAKLEIPNTKTFELGVGISMIVSPLSSISCVAGGTANFGSRPVTLQSTVLGTARIGTISGTLSNASNVTVERYIPAKRAWRALTAPVTTTTSIFANWQQNGTGNTINGLDIWMPSGTNGLTAGGASNSLLEFDSATNSWTGITATDGTSSMMSGDKNKPFMAFVTGPYGANNITSGATATTLKATGALLTGTQTYATAVGKYAFIGNPYASPLDLTAMLTSNAATFGGNIWVWDANAAGTRNVGTYNLFYSGTYTNITTNPVVFSTTQIQSGQAFFVKSTDGVSFSIQEAHKGSTFSNAILRRAAPELLRVGLYKEINSEWSGRDGAMAVILADADANQTPNKMANGTENIAFTKNELLFASAHHLPLVATDVLNIKVWNTTAGANYKLKINTEQFSSSLSATLEDAFTNSRTPLSLNGAVVDYPFAVTTDALSTGNRFQIVFESNALGIGNPKATGISILPNPVTSDTFQVNLGTLAMGTYAYTICNALGQEVEKGRVNNVAQNTSYTVKFKNATATGMYIMKVTGTDNSVFTAKMVKQ